MKELLTYVARNLVDHPEQVSVNEIQSDGETILELRVAPEDTGKVIGRQGRIAKEIRTLIRQARLGGDCRLIPPQGVSCPRRTRRRRFFVH